MTMSQKIVRRIFDTLKAKSDSSMDWNGRRSNPMVILVETMSARIQIEDFLSTEISNRQFISTDSSDFEGPHYAN